ncbi:protein arginine N-methyltransferase 5 [Nematostella vectensis]|uniref:protein arginine N-methyltransferase 5 n=1 Tax=Nematostella vectensis TaxID=45351 RepID=UPI002077502A|nr:protein arginine N-methyltransferase 5 [Nematostella vectensis]
MEDLGRLSCGRDLTSIPDLVVALGSASQSGFDFICAPICHPRYKREFLEEIPDRSKSFTRADLVLSSQDWSSLIVGKISPWINVGSLNEVVRKNSEKALMQEVNYAIHLGLPSVMLELGNYNIINLAHYVNDILINSHVQQLWIKVPMRCSEDMCDKSLFDEEDSMAEVTEKEKLEKDPWQWWNLFRTVCGNNRKAGIALEIPAELPPDVELERWIGEPIKACILPTDVFLTNRKGFPVLPKSHQAFLKQLFKLNVQLILSGCCKHKGKGVQFYYQYLEHLYQTQAPLDPLGRFAKGYEDYLQCPLQPLSDNLESQTYEIFERDPVKYAEYQKAIYEALIDRVPEASKDAIVTVIMVVGAGRGPLVRASLTAAENAGRRVRLYAVEKNPNAVVTLETLKTEEWGDKVTVVSSDMREWDAPEKADILVSELLGSFGDNELSPECLDGAQNFLKDGGISIPCDYTSYLSPLCSPKLHQEVSQGSKTDSKGPQAPFETPYVVRLHNIFELAKPQPCFTFYHPNRGKIDNSRFISLEFSVKASAMLHGFGGYFDATLYGNTKISIHPDTHSPGMFSWFPFYFPIQDPLYVEGGKTVALHMWRKCTGKKVWYEWSVSRPAPVPIHNPGGRSYVIGL